MCCALLVGRVCCEKVQLVGSKLTSLCLLIWHLQETHSVLVQSRFIHLEGSYTKETIDIICCMLLVMHSCKKLSSKTCSNFPHMTTLGDRICVLYCSPPPGGQSTVLIWVGFSHPQMSCGCYSVSVVYFWLLFSSQKDTDDITTMCPLSLMVHKTKYFPNKLCRKL